MIVTLQRPAILLKNLFVPVVGFVFYEQRTMDELLVKLLLKGSDARLLRLLLRRRISLVQQVGQIVIAIAIVFL